MTKKQIDEMDAPVEAMADEVHQVWANWMVYMFNQGHVDLVHSYQIGAWVMPPEKVERWHRQMTTPYDQLSESEKVSDREIAQKYIAIYQAALKEIDQNNKS